MAAAGILDGFRDLGHDVQEKPSDDTDVLLTTARYGEPIRWRDALLFTARRRFGIERSPTLYTLVSMTPTEFADMLDYFTKTLVKEEPDPKDYEFASLAPTAYHVLHEQGRRGGPILTLQRLLQAQAKSIRILLVVGEDLPESVYHLDLVGAHPASKFDDLSALYQDVAMRIATTVSTHEVNHHEVIDDPLDKATWDKLTTPGAMLQAARELGKRNFFTQMVRISDLVEVPIVSDAIANQYSEGCFATWEPAIDSLIATVTGSARPVDKENITEDDLAVIVGVRADGAGALVRTVEGKRNDPPSTEAVEMIDMDNALPRVILGPEWGAETAAPVVRSKLHGHRGVSAYDPQLVEYVSLDEAFYHYLVTCGSDAQASAIKAAFARAQALQNPDDPRQIAFTVLPGHGLMMVEKWIPDKAPFQALWEAMDTGAIQIDSLVPQGPMTYVPKDGRLVVQYEA